MANTEFDRLLLSQVMPDVRKHIDKESLKKSWTYRYPDKRCYGFQISKCAQFPEGVHVYGQANSAYEIRHRGYLVALKKLGVPGYTD